MMIQEKLAEAERELERILEEEEEFILSGRSFKLLAAAVLLVVKELSKDHEAEHIRQINSAYSPEEHDHCYHLLSVLAYTPPIRVYQCCHCGKKYSNRTW